MRSTSSLIHKLKTDFPAFTFFKTEQFSWSPTSFTVSYAPSQAQSAALLLHELSHGILKHQEYRRDIELLAMETAAWDKAKQLAETYHVRLQESVIQDHLDTYRDWLHARSTCPECSATGYQTAARQYSCAACTHQWRVNEARLCGLKRYAVSVTEKSNEK
jgi:hypothetical protein